LNLTPVLESPAFFVGALVAAEAARYKGVAVSSVSVLKVEAKEWPDSSLGCPQPGQYYAQIITPGWLAEIKAAGMTLEYHTDQSANKIVFCKESG
jgi:hypothetical protein